MINVRKEFKKCRTICATVGGFVDVLVWVARLRGWGACLCSVGGVGGVLTWLA